jgi:hypothetical protein
MASVTGWSRFVGGAPRFVGGALRCAALRRVGRAERRPKRRRG